MNAYVFRMSTQRFSLTSAALAALVSSFACTRHPTNRVSIRLLDERSRPLGRRNAFSPKNAIAAIEAWETSAAHEIELVAGSADASFDEANYISLRRSTAEKTVAATAGAYLHCLFSLPLDWHPLTSHLAQQVVPKLYLGCAFVHST